MSHEDTQGHQDIVYPATIPFVVLHLACFAVVWTGVSAAALGLFGSLFLVRLFAVTAGYHRYFSHRTYRTSRIAQFLLAVLCQSTTQRGVIWWAATHRAHHAHSDTPQDPHSRRQHGFWYAHMGWIFVRANDKPDYSLVKDLTRYPELVWLDRYPYFLPTILVILPCWLLAGWSGVIVGFGWSTTLVYHVTFAVNSFGHAGGARPYLTGDDSRNSFWLAVLTMGEGWHNNHHAYQRSSRHGFRKGEIDIGYSLLRLLARTGLIWDLREPPASIVANTAGPGRRVQERLAREIAAGFPVPSGSSHPPSVDEMHRHLQTLFLDVPAPNLLPLAEQARELLIARNPVVS
jgi:stearoyl-CoA desaturase (Delta-9 desaturase)